MSIRPPINGKSTNFHPEVIKMSEAIAKSQENAKKIHAKIQAICDKNTIASVSRRDMQRKLDEHFELISDIADDELTEVFIDEDGLAIVRS